MGGPLVPNKSLQRLTTSSDYDYSLVRTDLHEQEKISGDIHPYADRHPYFRKGQRSRFDNSSHRVAQLLHAGIEFNFQNYDIVSKDHFHILIAKIEPRRNSQF